MYYHTRDCSHGIATRRHPRIALASLSVVLYYQFTPQLYLSGTFFLFPYFLYILHLTILIIPCRSFFLGEIDIFRHRFSYLQGTGYLQINNYMLQRVSFLWFVNRS